jgi:hypothetical protein
MLLHRVSYFLMSLLPLEFLKLKGFRRFESQMIVSSRQLVYEGLVAKEAMVRSHGNPSEDMMFMTFERCGVVARELERVLLERLGYKAFIFTDLKGHYAVQSKCSGLIYDLVSNEGVFVGHEDKLQYANYLNAKVASNQSIEVFLNEYLTTNAPTDGYEIDTGKNTGSNKPVILADRRIFDV